MSKESIGVDQHYKILNSVTKLEISKGHLLWKISDVANDSGISRTLIYYYYGKDKEQLLNEAMKFMTETVFNLSQVEPVNVRERIKIVMQQLKQMPYLLILFYLNRRKENEMGEIIRSSEAKLFELFKGLYPKLTEQDFLVMYLLELGCVLHGDVPDAAIDQIFSKFEA